MTAGILTIGDEIVGGHTVDTNSAYLAQRLGELGLSIRSIVSVGDDIDGIGAALAGLVVTSDAVFVTGGLGPTDDDLTLKAVEAATGLPLRLDNTLHSRLETRFAGDSRVRPGIIRKLAMVPEGGAPLENPVGAAPGVALDYEGRRIYIMPGVPEEMKAVFERGIVPDLKRLPRREVTASRVLKTTGLRESEIARLLETTDLGSDVRLGYLPTLSGVDLRLAATSACEEAASGALDKAARSLAEVLGDAIYSDRGKQLHCVVGTMLIERAMTIAVAESCTGGLITHLLTEVPGISACLERGIVAYSNDAKAENLSVCRDLIDRHGAVSREVAGAMASGVRQLAGAGLGLATTGTAGPSGGSDEKPVGLVYTALAHRDGCVVERNVFRGTRHAIKIRAATYALDMVRYHLLGEAG
jgi:nicotinamide-nucleotide amidase